MGGTSDNTGPNNPAPAPPGPAERSDATAKNLAIPLPEFLKEIHATLQRAEQAYAQGDLAQAACTATEGLTILRLPLPKPGKTQVPTHYELFFRCFLHHDVYRAALALYKQGLLQQYRAEAEPLWQRAWGLLEGKFAGFDERLALTAGTTDFPVAGRVLRGLLRLRQKLQEHLHG